MKQGNYNDELATPVKKYKNTVVFSDSSATNTKLPEEYQNYRFRLQYFGLRTEAFVQ
jgi:hypothetical protein